VIHHRQNPIVKKCMFTGNTFWSQLHGKISIASEERLTNRVQSASELKRSRNNFPWGISQYTNYKLLIRQDYIPNAIKVNLNPHTHKNNKAGNSCKHYLWVFTARQTNLNMSLLISTVACSYKTSGCDSEILNDFWGHIYTWFGNCLRSCFRVAVCHW
jgi:hypothetical protein